MELYKMAERKKERTNRDKDEIEFTKNPEEFTFQPNAHKYKNAVKQMSPGVQRKEKFQEVKTTKREKSVPTTLRGGQSTTVVNTKTTTSSVAQKSVTKPVKTTKNFDTSSSDDEKFEGEPLLYVDVNFGGNDKTRIALFEKSNPEKVARKFVKQHGLDE